MTLEEQCGTCKGLQSIVIFDRKGGHEVFGCPKCGPFTEEVREGIKKRMKNNEWKPIERRNYNG